LNEADRSPRGTPAVRPARSDELPWLQQVETSAGLRFATVGLPGVAAGAPTPLCALQSAREAGLLWVVDAGAGRAVGFARAVRLASSLHLAEVSVLPAHGRRGLGTALVQAAARAGERLAAKTLTLSTFAEVPWNAPFYAKLGFRVVPERELTPELVAIRQREATDGLPIERRVIMALALPSRS